MRKFVCFSQGEGEPACEENPEGMRVHCLHRIDDQNLVCCHCGDLYEDDRPHEDPEGHGTYAEEPNMKNSEKMEMVLAGLLRESKPKATTEKQTLTKCPQCGAITTGNPCSNCGYNKL